MTVAAGTPHAHAGPAHSHAHHHHPAPAHAPWTSPEDALASLEASGAVLHTRPAHTILTGSVLGGALLGFGCGFTILAVGGLAPALAALGPAAPQLLSGALFPIGLTLILLSKAELGTGNQYYTTIALFNTADKRPLTAKLAASARVVFLSGAGNAVGCAATAVFFSSLTLLAGDPWAAYGGALALKKASLPTGVMFARAMLTNALVNLAIFQAAGEKTAPAKMAALWMPIMLFVAFGLEHSIANLFFFPYAMASGAELPLLDVARNIAVVFAGNWAGAALFMGGLHRFHLLKGWARAAAAAAPAAAAGGATAAEAGAITSLPGLASAVWAAVTGRLAR